MLLIARVSRLACFLKDEAKGFREAVREEVESERNNKQIEDVFSRIDRCCGKTVHHVGCLDHPGWIWCYSSSSYPKPLSSNPKDMEVKFSQEPPHLANEMLSVRLSSKSSPVPIPMAAASPGLCCLTVTVPVETH